MDQKEFFDEDDSVSQSDIISLCSSSLEEFWKNFYLKNIKTSNYKKICKKIDKCIENKYPIPYLNKKCIFYGLNMKVVKGVFIPQHDTEILVEKALFIINKMWSNDKKVRILEIGTGSGNISISLAKENHLWEIKSVDCSKKALSIAKENSEKLSVNNIDFIHSNLFSKIGGKFDVIISNPPYLSYKDYFKVSSYTRKQPKKALIAKEDGYWFYRKIIEKSVNFLNRNFLIIFEIGYNQSDKIIKLSLAYYSDVKVEIFEDFNSKKRVIALYNFKEVW